MSFKKNILLILILCLLIAILAGCNRGTICPTYASAKTYQRK